MNIRAYRSRTGIPLFFALTVALLAGPAWSAAKSVIFLIGDGMGPMTVRAASIKLHGRDGKLVMQGFKIRFGWVFFN